jgi:nucleotide sugar dehydrogenase
MKAIVTVIGLGRIGLPIALVTAAKVHRVFGVDIDAVLVKELKEGRTRLLEPRLTELLHLCSDRFEPTTNLKSALLRSSVILCCVGTRRFARNRPDLRLLWKIIKDLSEHELKGRLIILKTTVPIGTTREITNYLERATGLRADKDFYMAFSPERTVEGRAVEELLKLPVVVGAVGEASLQRAVRFYKSTGADVVKVVSPEAAELIKLVDNAYRLTKFAFSNDITLVAERIGANAFDVIEAANYKYPRNDIPYPTCGVSGYCLSKDPYYLEEAFKPMRMERGFSSIWMCARRSYDHRTKSLVKQIEQSLKMKGMKFRESRTLVCGIAFKSNIDDIRDSHGLLIARELAKRGSQVSIWDPWITVSVNGFQMHREPTAAFRDKDVAIFTVAHRQFVEVAKREKMRQLTKLMRTPVVYDGAGLFRRDRVMGSSFDLIGTGYPDMGNRPHQHSGKDSVTPMPASSRQTAMRHKFRIGTKHSESSDH